MDAETERQIRRAVAAVDDGRIDTAFERATRNRSVTRVLEDGTVDTVPGARQAAGVASLGTSEVAIAHKLSGTPAFVAVTPRANVACWESRRADETFIYLSAADTVAVMWFAVI